MVVLKREEGAHEPKDAITSRSWEWPSSYSQQEKRDLSLITAQRTEFCQRLESGGSKNSKPRPLYKKPGKKDSWNKQVYTAILLSVCYINICLSVTPACWYFKLDPPFMEMKHTADL